MAKLGRVHSVSLQSASYNGLLPAQYKTHDRLIAQACAVLISPSSSSVFVKAMLSQPSWVLASVLALVIVSHDKPADNVPVVIICMWRVGCKRYTA